MYVCVEHSRLQYLRFHQKEIRAEVYSGAIEAMDNEVEDEVVGRRVVLPSSFIGGPRSMQQLYQETITLASEYGNPSLFITMTANPQWPEILEELEDKQTPNNRPDLIARAFYYRFHSMLQDVTKYERFGKCPAYVYTIDISEEGPAACPPHPLLGSRCKACNTRGCRLSNLSTTSRPAPRT